MGKFISFDRGGKFLVYHRTVLCLSFDHGGKIHYQRTNKYNIKSFNIENYIVKNQKTVFNKRLKLLSKNDR